MPMQEFFQDQLDQLKAFMADPGQTVRVVFVDPDLKPVLTKMLAGLDRDPSTPHVLIPCSARFATRDSFFKALLGELLESYRASAVELVEAGVFEPFSPKDLSRDPPQDRVVLYLSSLAEGLPDHVGSLVVLLDPAEVSDAKGFRDALAWLAGNVWSAWVKFLVIDDRVKPRAKGVEELHERAAVQTFYLPPEEIEARARKTALSSDGISFDARRQAAAMTAGFAIARQDYAAAAEAYRVQSEMAKAVGAGNAEEAQARYGLGNALLAQKDFAAAEVELGRSLELANADRQFAFMAMVLAQLGVAVQGQGRIEQAAECFCVARDTARTANVPPLEGFVLDTAAKCHLAARDAAAAERCWLDALEVYDGIKSDSLADVRDAGRKDVISKLESLHKETRRPGKWTELLAARGKCA
jgi:tetratricopeptide (TPR) repeat protein